MFYVYHGYVSPDNYDSSYRPTYQLSKFETEEALMAFKKEFEEDLNDDCQNPIFRIVSGQEVFLQPVETVTTWKLT